MSHIIIEVEKRMHMGRTKYGHGVRIIDNMSDYTQNKQDSFLEMQLEEILDGIIYTVAAYLRHICSLYKIKLANEDNNEDICNVITNGITFPDKRSQVYKELLEDMINVYNKTLVLKTI
jgi:hypothetical protein